MKKKVISIIMAALLLVILGGATVLAAGNARQESPGQAGGSQRDAGAVTGTCTGVLDRTLDHCVYARYNVGSGYNNSGNNGACICGGSHTFTDQDGDGICDYRNNAAGHHGTGAGGHHGGRGCR